MVVGATSGIGRAVALQVAAEGAAVVVAGRRAELGTGLVAEIVDGGGRALFVRCDATVEEDVASAVEAAVAEFGQVNVPSTTPAGWSRPDRSISCRMTGGGPSST